MFLASWACPHVPARHCGSGPSLAPPAEACACLPRRPRTLTWGPSLQLEQAVRLESGELETQEPRGLARQSVELRRQLQEEQASYRRKLQAYQEGQQRQAQLVQRLQVKVRVTHSCSYPAMGSLCPAPTPGANHPLAPIRRFSSTRRSARRWSSSFWRDRSHFIPPVTLPRRDLRRPHFTDGKAEPPRDGVTCSAVGQLERGNLNPGLQDSERKRHRRKTAEAPEGLIHSFTHARVQTTLTECTAAVGQWGDGGLWDRLRP